jgi:glycosyltransferase involved in cell wall biosynthesis
MSEMINLGFDAKRAFHNFRGLGNYSRTLLEGLVRYAPQTELYLFTPPFKEKEVQFFLNNLERTHVMGPRTSLGKTFHSFWRSYSLAQSITEANVQLYHGLSHELPIGIEKLPIPSVVTIHDLIYIRYPEFFPWIDRKIYHQKFNHSVSKSTRVLAICEQTKQDLVHFLNVDEKKISVVYQACHPRFYGRVHADDLKRSRLTYQLGQRPYILYVGAFEKRKNVIALIHAFATLQDKIDHHLVLVGNGKTYKKLMLDLISYYKLQDKVHLLSDVPENDLPALYQGASLFVFPSFYEGFGLPIVEALFSETPVITSAGSCFPESGGPGTIYTEAGNIEQLREEMLGVLTSDDKAHQMRVQGREFVEKFHLKNTTADLMNFYGSVINERLVNS